MPFYISKEELEHLYYDKKMSLEEIAALKGTSRSTIGRRCKEYGIKMRYAPKNHAQFARELEQVHGDQYEVADEYKGTESKVLIRHRRCGFEWRAYPGNLLKGHGCPLCAGNKKLTTEQYIEKVKENHGEEYSILGQYRGMNQKILVRHNKCGHIWYVLASCLTRGQGCPNCRGKRIGEQLRKSHRHFIKEVYDLVGCEYSILSLYKTAHIKVKVRHNKCGYVWCLAPAHFLSGTRCPKCARNLKRDTKQFKRLVYAEVGDEYTVLGEYVNSQTGILMRHNACGHTWKVHPNHFLINGTRCPVCVSQKQGRKQALTQQQFEEKLKAAHGSEYTVLSEYVNGSVKILAKHNVCGYRWEVYPYNLLRGHGCPKCKSTSLAEDRVYGYLRKKNIKFKHQATFKDCRNELPLPFDFQIFVGPKYFLLELDGQQHYEAIKYWGGEEALRYVQRNDSIKNQYCRKHNIKLVRIPYWEFGNIEEILERILESEGGHKIA